MKIAFFSDSYVPQINGVVTQLRNMSEELARRGHEVMVVAPSHTGRFYTAEEKGVKALFLSSVALPTYSDYRITLPHSTRVFREMESFKPDMIHVHTPFGVGWLGLRCAKKLRIPVVGTYHTLLPEFLMYLPLPLLRKTSVAKQTTWKYTNLFYKRCDLVTAPTQRMKDELSRNGLHGAVVLPNAIDFRLFNRFSEKKNGGKTTRLIYFGRISYEKNIEVLLLALKHLAWRGHEVSLSITGSGPALHYLEKIALGQRLMRHVTFHAAMPQDELARHVASHDVFVTASTIETQGLTILEAMAAGLPCVGVDFLAIPDTIHGGKNGFLFRPYDFVEAAAKVEKLVSSKALRKKLGENAVETAREFSVGRVASMTERLYGETVTRFKAK